MEVREETVRVSDNESACDMTPRPSSSFQAHHQRMEKVSQFETFRWSRIERDKKNNLVSSRLTLHRVVMSCSNHMPILDRDEGVKKGVQKIH